MRCKFIASLFMLCIHPTYAQGDDNCIEKRDKPLQCQHYIIKKTDPSVVLTSKIKSPSVCICLSDFPFLYEVPLGKPDKGSVTLLQSWGLSVNDLNRILQF